MNFHFFSSERIQTFLFLSFALRPSFPHFSLSQKADLYELQQQGSKPSFSGWVWLVEALRGNWREVRRVVLTWLFPGSLTEGSCKASSFLCPSVNPTAPLNVAGSFSLCLSLSYSRVGAPCPHVLGPRTVTVLLFSWHPFEKGDQSLREIDGLELII